MSQPRIGRFTRQAKDQSERSKYFLSAETAGGLPDHCTQGFLGVLTAVSPAPRGGGSLPAYRIASLATLVEDVIVRVDPVTNGARPVYWPGDESNALYLTSACNNRCRMCSQPNLRETGSDLEEFLRIVELIPDQPEILGVTGGEPTLLGDQLFLLLDRIHALLPTTELNLLTNGRMYCYDDYAERLASIGHPRLISAIPLYSDAADVHDEIVGTEGAFDQTVKGVYNAARWHLKVEVRVILFRRVVELLEQLAEFIYRNFPFVGHIALMGLENMGTAVRNWDSLWIDPLDYSDVLERTVRFLFARRMPVSI